MVKQSRYSYSGTIAKLTKAINDGGNTIFATIDQANAATSVGLKLRPTTLIVFGNPRGGTPIMDKFPLAGLDLPLKLLVWEQDNKVNVAFTPTREIAARYGVTGMDTQINNIERVLETLVNVVVT
jgi:uncharacterized protein (DUF302 family)